MDRMAYPWSHLHLAFLVVLLVNRRKDVVLIRHSSGAGIPLRLDVARARAGHLASHVRF